MPLTKVSLGDLGAGLTLPFDLQQVASLDHFGFYLYLAHGVVAAHRHLLYGELFYLVDGMLTLDGENGSTVIQPGEFAVVPKGVEHVSKSSVDSIVLLGHTRIEPQRKNGHGGINQGQQNITKVAPRLVIHGLAQAFFSVSLIQLDEIALRAAWCQGVVGWHRHADHDELLLVQEGLLEVATNSSTVLLGANELVVIPSNSMHQLRTHEQTLLLSMVNSELSSSAQMGHIG